MSYSSIPEEIDENQVHSDISMYTMKTNMRSIEEYKKSTANLHNEKRKRGSYRRSDLINLKTIQVENAKIGNDLEIRKRAVHIRGNVVIGNWKDNELDGEVVIKFCNGDIFKGVFDKGKKVSGVHKFANGFEYEGKFVNESFHGFGRLTDPKNRKIFCHWAEGVPGKKGRIEYENGIVYCGELENLKKSGEGYLFFKNGDKFMGNFRNGKIYGYGKLYQNDCKTAQGFWVNGILDERQSIKTALNFVLQEL